MMRTTTEPGSTFSEAIDAASGALVFAGIVAVIGAVVGLAGWAAGTYMTAAVLLGCGVLSALVAAAVWGVLHWGIDEVDETTAAAPVTSPETTLKRAA